MEWHPLGSQAFYPLQNQKWLVVVASGSDPCDPENLHVFTATGQQGANYARNTWHRPLLVHHPDSDFFIVDRGGQGNNLEEREFSDTVLVAGPGLIFARHNIRVPGQNNAWLVCGTDRGKEVRFFAGFIMRQHRWDTQILQVIPDKMDQWKVRISANGIKTNKPLDHRNRKEWISHGVLGL